MDIEFYKIEGCNVCKETAKALKGLGLSYEEFDADDDSNTRVITWMEDFFDSAKYPKLIVYKDGITYFINPSGSKELSNGIITKYLWYNSVEDIATHLKNINK